MSIDLEALAKEFNMNDAPLNSCENTIDIESLNTDDLCNPDIVISTNINKANAILDRIIEEINSSGMSPRLGEVASQLIANINQAAGQIYTKKFDISTILLKHKMLQLKEREVKLKEITAKQNMGNGDGDTINQNIIVTDRETVLKLLKEHRTEIKQITDL